LIAVRGMKGFPYTIKETIDAYGTTASTRNAILEAVDTNGRSPAPYHSSIKDARRRSPY
jgi:hypothetical protein